MGHGLERRRRQTAGREVMRNVLKIVLAAIAIAVGILAQTPEPPKQPLPFSHKLHVAQGLKCIGCHVNPDPGEQMTITATAKPTPATPAIIAIRPIEAVIWKYTFANRCRLV